MKDNEPKKALISMQALIKGGSYEHTPTVQTFLRKRRPHLWVFFVRVCYRRRSSKEDPLVDTAYESVFSQWRKYRLTIRVLISTSHWPDIYMSPYTFYLPIACTACGFKNA